MATSEYTAEKPHIWAAVEVWSESFIESVDPTDSEPIPDANRGSWFCPCVTIYDAERALSLCDEYGIERVVDLGAGDFRFSLYADRQGFDVVAYETLGDLVDSVTDRFDMGGIDVRQHDYYADFEELVGRDTAVCCFGGTNELPRVPSDGLAVEGYFETGITAWNAGDVVAEWPDA